jgi:hypothetical protein
MNPLLRVVLVLSAGALVALAASLFALIALARSVPDMDAGGSTSPTADRAAR